MAKDPYANEIINKEWNKTVYKYIKAVKGITKPNIEDSEGVKRACDEYMQVSEDFEIKPSVSGLALALGVNREILLKWLRGEVSIRTADIIAECYSLIEIFDETAMKDNRINPVAGVFNMKNNHGYKDEVEIKHTDEKKPSNEEIARIYGQHVEIIDAQPSAVIEQKKVEKVIEPPKEETKPLVVDTTTDDTIPF